MWLFFRVPADTDTWKDRDPFIPPLSLRYTVLSKGWGARREGECEDWRESRIILIVGADEYLPRMNTDLFNSPCCLDGTP